MRKELEIPISPALTQEINSLLVLRRHTPNFADEHLDFSTRFLSITVPLIHKGSRHNPSEKQIKDYATGWQVEYSIDDSLKSRAFAKLSRNKERSGTCTITTGMYLALNDAFHRAMSSDCILRQNAVKEDRVYRLPSAKTNTFEMKRFMCVETDKCLLQPFSRFADYNPSFNTQGMHPSQLGAFFMKVPEPEEQRILAQWLTIMALNFVLLHEEAHYIHGHLHLLKEVNSFQFSPDNILMADGNSQKTTGLDDISFKCLEFEADTSAARGMVDIFLAPQFPWPQLKSFDVNSPGWKVRCILFVIGVVFQIFDYGAESNNAHDHYPSYICRFMNSSIQTFGRLSNRASIFSGNLNQTKDAEKWMEEILTITSLSAISDLQYFARDINNNSLMQVPLAMMRLSQMSDDDSLALSVSLQKLYSLMMVWAFGDVISNLGDTSGRNDSDLESTLNKLQSVTSGELNEHESEFVRLIECFEKNLKMQLGKYRVMATGYDTETHQ